MRLEKELCLFNEAPFAFEVIFFLVGVVVQLRPSVLRE
jgi:hypothetical protein